MSTLHVPTKALLGAMLLGVATVVLARLAKTPSRAAAREPDTQTDAHADVSDIAWRPVDSAAKRAGRFSPRAPYADGLSHREEDASHLPGTPAPVEAAKHGDPLGEPFSVGAVGEVEPSAMNKGGLGDGGR